MIVILLAVVLFNGCSTTGSKDDEIGVIEPPIPWPPPYLHNHPKIEGIPCPYAKAFKKETEEVYQEIIRDRVNVGRVGGVEKTDSFHRRGESTLIQQER